MARVVRITIEYDMDDENKPLAAELQDWYDDAIGFHDIANNPDEHTKIKIEQVETGE